MITTMATINKIREVSQCSNISVWTLEQLISRYCIPGVVSVDLPMCHRVLTRAAVRSVPVDWFPLTLRRRPVARALIACLLHVPAAAAAVDAALTSVVIVDAMTASRVVVWLIAADRGHRNCLRPLQIDSSSAPRRARYSSSENLHAASDFYTRSFIHHKSGST